MKKLQDLVNDLTTEFYKEDRSCGLAACTRHPGDVARGGLLRLHE